MSGRGARRSRLHAAPLADALDDPNDGRRTAGRALAERYTWAEAARRHRELYRSLAVGEPTSGTLVGWVPPTVPFVGPDRESAAAPTGCGERAP